VNIDYRLSNEAPVYVEVTNVVGAKVAEFTLTSGFETQTVDLGKFGAGTYLLNIKNQQESTTKKVVIAQ
jgi:hypothetical protein